MPVGLLLDGFLSLLFISTVLYAVKVQPHYFVVFLLIFNLCVGAVSIIFIENGKYISELGVVSYYNNSTPYMLLNYSALIVGVFFGIAVIVQRKYRFSMLRFAHRKFDRTELIVAIILAISIIVLEYASLIIYGIPLLDGRNKVEYFNENQILQSIGSSASYVSLILSILYFNKRQRILIVLFVLHLVFQILAAQKFSSLIVNIIAWFSVYFIFIRRIQLNTKIVLTTLIVILLINAVFYYNYKKNTFSDVLGMTTIEAMTYRLFYLSAHPYWGVYNFIKGGHDLPHYSNHEKIEGSKTLVRLLNPSENIDDSLARGVTFGMAFPAYFMLYINLYLVPVISVIWGIFVGIVGGFFIRSVLAHKIFYSVILFVILNMLMRSTVLGNFYFIFNAKLILGLLLLVLIILIKNSCVKNP